MKKILVVFYVCFLPVSLFAQFSIEGKIVDKLSNEPLAGTVVKIENTVLYAIADSDGRFKISGLTKKYYFITVSLLGYVSQSKKIYIEKSLYLDFFLEQNVFIQDEIIINATRAGNNTPVASQIIEFEQIKPVNLGQDLPVLLSQQTSVVTTSDAGAGVGYTGIRIRGSDITRINVTVNGIPLNDPESHGVWFVNMPDFASSVNNLQLQRGVGTSTNGAGAFGATMNFMTTVLNEVPYAELNSSIGSFSTFKNSFLVGTGIIDSFFSVDFRLSQISSDGYVDRAFSKLNSYFLFINFFNNHTLLRLISFSGKEKTYQAWWGVPKAWLLNDTDDVKRYILHGLFTESQYNNLITSKPETYNYYTYENETDNYTQTHFQLHLSHEFTKQLAGNVSLHYTLGQGYYEQFRENDEFSDYGLNNPIIGNDTIKNTSLIRQKWLDNDFYGATWSLIFKNKVLDITWGGAFNQYSGNHFGKIIWAEFSSTLPFNYEWYANKGLKNDFNSYLKGNYAITERLLYYLDIQYRWIIYSINGYHDDLRDISLEKSYGFFNPKTGLMYKIQRNQQLYLSFANASKEPSRYSSRAPPTSVIEATSSTLSLGYSRLSE